MTAKAKAVLCVALAAVIWSLDSAFRFSAVEAINPLVVVFLEHVFGLVLITPFLFWKKTPDPRRIQPKHLFAVGALGVGGSALGVLCYSESLRFLGPSTVNLFPLLKPFLVLGLAFFLLKEREGGYIFQLASWILLSAILLCAPDLSFGFQSQSEDAFWQGVSWGIGAIFVWGCATIAGKYLLGFYSVPTVMFFRWLAGVLGLAALLFVKGGFGQVALALSSSSLLSVLAFGTLLGVLPVWIYYIGLKQLPAGVVSLIELLYPLFGIVFPVLRFHRSLASVQWIGAAMMLSGIMFLIFLEVGFSSTNDRSKKAMKR